LNSRTLPPPRLFSRSRRPTRRDTLAPLRHVEVRCHRRPVRIRPDNGIRSPCPAWRHCQGWSWPVPPLRRCHHSLILVYRRL